jgi:hypothetical protein
MFHISMPIADAAPCGRPSGLSFKLKPGEKHEACRPDRSPMAEKAHEDKAAMAAGTWLRKRPIAALACRAMLAPAASPT